MIKIQNQLTFQFSIGDVQDFIDPTNLEYFALYEEECLENVGLCGLPYYIFGCLQQA